jgi:hypothetical protein
MVEAAIGMVVAVTIILFGIYFAEVGYLSLKVQEAGTAAMWDSTGRLMHDLNSNSRRRVEPDGRIVNEPSPKRWQRWRESIQKTETELKERYADFDGRSSAANGSTLTQAVTRASNLEIACEPVQDLATPMTHQEALGELGPYGAAIYGTAGGSVSCQAKARLTGFGVPSSFLDGDWSLETKHNRYEELDVCTTGRMAYGTCSTRLPLLLDDWGFSGELENKECKVRGSAGCENPAFQLAADIMGPFPSVGPMLELVRLVKPLQGVATGMNVSFAGSESEFADGLDAHGETYWYTTPFHEDYHQKAFNLRQNTFLGIDIRDNRAALAPL